MVAELLESGVEVDVTASFRTMTTMLELASTYKNLDLVRLLLHHGASGDHMCYLGCGASVLCWQTSDLRTNHSSMDVYNVLSESTCVDLHHDEHDRALAVELAAYNGCASQIDSLVRFGFDIYQSDLGPMGTIALAAEHGNYSSYSALVSHFGGDVFGYEFNGMAGSEFLLKCTIMGKALSFLGYPEPTREYDKILWDLLQRCGKSTFAVAAKAGCRSSTV